MVIILLGNGFEDIEALAPCDVLRRGGLDVRLVGINGKQIVTSRGVTVTADCLPEELGDEKPELLIIPGGNVGVDNIWESAWAVEKIKACREAGVPTAAICAGPVILSRPGYLKNKRAVCHPSRAAELECGEYCPGESVVEDGDIITARAAGSSLDLGFALLRRLRGEEISAQVAAAMCYIEK